MTIDRFRNRYWFLSNMSDLKPVCFQGVSAPTVEHLFQAFKTTDPSERAWVLQASTPFDAKKRGRRVTMRSGWNHMRVELMLRLLRVKFSDPTLQDALLATGNQELIEGNTWGDRFWGVDMRTGQGRNMLGTLLMRVRQELRDAQ